jgi:RNA polymerase sigma-32 factor
MEQRLAGRDMSFDPDPSDDDERAMPVSYLPSPGADPAETIEQRDWEVDAHDRLGSALEGLDDRSRNVLRRRWLTESKATLHELAAEYGVSAERIRQIEGQAIAKLKSLMAPAASEKSR